MNLGECPFNAHIGSIKVVVLLQTLLQEGDLLAQGVNIFAKIFYLDSIAVHEPIRVDLRQDLVLMLLLDQNFFDVGLALHLER